jgi:hypothetical protein
MRSSLDRRRGMGRLDTIVAGGSLDLDDGGECWREVCCRILD